MSVTLIVSDRIARQLQRLQWAKGDKTEDKLARLIEGSVSPPLSQLQPYRSTAHPKVRYGFDQFERQQITLDKGFTWEVESDAIAWETAVDGIRTVQRQLSRASEWRRLTNFWSKHLRLPSGSGSVRELQIIDRSQVFLQPLVAARLMAAVRQPVH